MLASPAWKLLIRCCSSVTGRKINWSTYGLGAFQYDGLRTMVILLSRTHSLSMNGPAPTGLLPYWLPLSLSALGEAMRARPAADRGNCTFVAVSVRRNVRGSTTSIVLRVFAVDALLEWFAGSW